MVGAVVAWEAINMHIQEYGVLMDWLSVDDVEVCAYVPNTLVVWLFLHTLGTLTFMSDDVHSNPIFPLFFFFVTR